jgi:hypothetical protein
MKQEIAVMRRIQVALQPLDLGAVGASRVGE